MKNLVRAGVFAAAMSMSVQAAETVDLDVINKIRDEGFNRSQVMETLQHLSDNIGQRLTGSPAMLEANNWTKDKLTEWGLENAHLEGFEFGYGWTAERSEVFMTAPRRTQLYALPLTWHPGTNGVVEGEVIFAPMSSKDDFAKWEGKLSGKIVMVHSVPKQKPPTNQVFTRHDSESLDKAGDYTIPMGDPEAGTEGWR